MAAWLGSRAVHNALGSLKSTQFLLCRKDPLALIGIGAIFFPFVLLGIAVAAGVVDLSVYH